MLPPWCAPPMRGREGELIFRLVYEQAKCKAGQAAVDLLYGGFRHPGGL